MSTPAPGILGLAIFEENTPTAHRFDGHNISVSSPDISTITRTTGRGTIKKVATSFEYVIRHDDASLHATMDSGAHGTLQWKLCVAGFDSFLFVLDQCTFVPEETPQFDPESEEFPFQVRFIIRGGTKIATGINGVFAYQKTQGNSAFADDDSNNLADGFTNSNVESVTFSGGNQTLDNSSGAGGMYIQIPFPIAGINIMASINVDTLTSGTPDLQLDSIDSDGSSSLGSDTKTISGTGTASLDSPHTTVSGIFYLRFYPANDATTYNIVVTDPSLRIGSATTFVNY